MERRGTSLLSPVLCVSGLICLSACTPSQSAIPTGTALIAAPENLIGATPQDLTAEFGQPALLRVDGTAQVWLYHSPSCGLNLILYPDAAGVPRVAIASAADGGAIIGGCQASLQQSHIDAQSDISRPANIARPAALEPPAAS